MTQRTTRAQVDAKLTLLNDVSKCAYELDSAYGGYSIVRMDAPGTGEREHPMRHLLDQDVIVLLPCPLARPAQEARGGATVTRVPALP